MRAFLAVELPDAARSALHRLQQELRHAEADVTWVEPTNIHLTMRFLGEMSEAQCGQIQAMSRAAAAQAAPIMMKLSALGAFPSAQAPRVVWVGIEQGKAELARLADLLEEGCVQAGVPKADHPFAAHVTLGRVRSPRGRAKLVKQLQELRWTPPAPFVADHLTLFESQLSNAGPAYRILEQFSLRK